MTELAACPVFDGLTLLWREIQGERKASASDVNLLQETLVKGQGPGRGKGGLPSPLSLAAPSPLSTSVSESDSGPEVEVPSAHHLCECAPSLSAIRQRSSFSPAISQTPVVLRRSQMGDMRSEVGTLGQRQTAELGKGLGRTVPLSPACTRSGGRMNKPQDYRPTNLLSYVATSSVFPLQANILGVSKNLGALPSAGFMRAASPTPPAQHGRSQ